MKPGQMMRPLQSMVCLAAAGVGDVADGGDVAVADSDAAFVGLAAGAVDDRAALEEDVGFGGGLGACGEDRCDDQAGGEEPILEFWNGAFSGELVASRCVASGLSFGTAANRRESIFYSKSR